MKPLEILSALPQGARARPDAIVDSPAFAMPCRLGEESVVVRRASVEPAMSEMLALAVTFGDEPHELCLARSPRFPDLDRLWDRRGEVPQAVLLALVEKECGPLFQALENAVRRQMRLVGLEDAARDASEAPRIAVEIDGPSGGLLFSLTRSATVVSAFGVLRNLDLAHASIRSQTLPAEVEYAVFALPAADLATLAPGDAVLLPEIGTTDPKLVVGGRFVLDASGVSAYVEDALVRVRAAQARTVSLGEIFDAVEAPPRLAAAEPGAQLRLVRAGASVAFGRLDGLGEAHAFVVEATS